MSSKKAQEAIKVYGNLLVETKARLSFVDNAINGQMKLPSKVVEEFSYLQLRMACESIALGCLTIHGEMLGDKVRNIQDNWNGGIIINRLEKLHSDFYPMPFLEEIQPSGVRHLAEIKQPYLTRQDLIKLVGICGEKLHMGTVKKLLDENTKYNFSFSDIKNWSDKIHNLINHHQFRLLDNRTLYVCNIIGGLYTYNAEIIVAESY